MRRWVVLVLPKLRSVVGYPTTALFGMLADAGYLDPDEWAIRCGELVKLRSFARNCWT
jgi:hypothetical protein